MKQKFKLTPLEKSWILYDIGNSAFILMVSTLIPIFFNSLADSAGVNEDLYLSYWGYAGSIATILVAIIGPICGTLADRSMKKPFFLLSVAMGALGCAALGIVSHWLVFLGVFVIARVGYSSSIIFYDSMLTEVIFCITCYCIVLILEFVPLILENRQLMKNRFIHALAHNFHVYMPIFAGIGAFLSTFHQGSLGGMYGVLFGRPYLFREGFFIWPWTFFLFVLSAVASGPMFTVLVCTFMEKLSGRKLVSWDVKQLMGRIAGTMLIVYTFFKCLDSWYWAVDTLAMQGLTFDDMFYGWIYGKWLFWTEHLLLIVPMFVLMKKSLREKPVVFYSMMILVCASITLNRYLLTVQGLAMPVMPFDAWQTYAPNWVEWACCALVFAYSAMALSLAYRYTPIFPQEAELNKQ